MPQNLVLDLLSRHKMIEGLAQPPSAHRPELVKTVVHNQHLAELKSLLAKMSVGEIARVVDPLPLADARLLWAQIDPARHNDLLWELSAERGVALSGGAEPCFQYGEVTAYEMVNGRSRITEVSRRSDLEALSPLWIDVLGASRSERAWLSRRYALELPDPEELTDLETSARFYVEENGELHLHSNFLLDRKGEARSIPVAFIINADVSTLFSIRAEDMPVFRLQRHRMRLQPTEMSDCRDVLLALYGADVEYSADSLEDTYNTLRAVGKKVLSEHVSDTDATRILADIAEEEDQNGRIRGNMLDTQRAVSFLMRGKFLSAEQQEDAREIIRDIESLNSHTAFLFEKINFLMDATVGFINVNQNRRVTQLTIAGVVFMPLNVLAGVGGMSEFSMMTQGIPWPVAYGCFMAAMIMLGWGTYAGLKLYERRREKLRLARMNASLSLPVSSPHR